MIQSQKEINSLFVVTKKLMIDGKEEANGDIVPDQPVFIFEKSTHKLNLSWHNGYVICDKVSDNSFWVDNQHYKIRLNRKLI